MKQFIKNFRAEIIILLLLIIGFTLLLGDFGIRKAGEHAYWTVYDLLHEKFASVSEYIGGMSSYEMVGVLLIGLALVYLYMRIRYRYRKTAIYAAVACPRCNGKIKRVHRSAFDRFLSKTFMPGARRYQCVNPECGWSGLRHQRYRLDQLRESEIPDSQKTPTAR